MVDDHGAARGHRPSCLVLGGGGRHSRGCHVRRGPPGRVRGRRRSCRRDAHVPTGAACRGRGQVRGAGVEPGEPGLPARVRVGNDVGLAGNWEAGRCRRPPRCRARPTAGRCSAASRPRGRDAYLQFVRSVFSTGVDRVEVEAQARRGEHLALVRVVHAGPMASLATVQVVQLDAAGRHILRHELFDPDQLDDAFADLDEPFLARARPPAATAWRAVCRATTCATPPGRRRVPGARRDDVVVEDHRHARAGARGLRRVPQHVPGDVRAGARRPRGTSSRTWACRRGRRRSHQDRRPHDRRWSLPRRHDHGRRSRQRRGAPAGAVRRGRRRAGPSPLCRARRRGDSRLERGRALLQQGLDALAVVGAAHVVLEQPLGHLDGGADVAVEVGVELALGRDDRRRADLVGEDPGVLVGRGQELVGGQRPG